MKRNALTEYTEPLRLEQDLGKNTVLTPKNLNRKMLVIGYVFTVFWLAMYSSPFAGVAALLCFLNDFTANASEDDEEEEEQPTRYIEYDDEADYYPEEDVAPSRPASISRVQSRTQQLPPRQERQQQTFLSLVLDAPFSSRAIYGAERSGKTYFASGITQQLALKGIEIYHINFFSPVLADLDEDGEYWAHAESVRCDLQDQPSMNELVENVQRGVEVVEAFVKAPSNPGAILVVDEWQAFTTKNKNYDEVLQPLRAILYDQIAGLRSSGTKRGKAMWTISPGLVAGALTDEGKGVKQLPPAVVSVAPGKRVTWRGSVVASCNTLLAELKNNGVRVPPPQGSWDCDRIAYANNGWIPLGDVKVLSPEELKKKIEVATY